MAKLAVVTGGAGFIGSHLCERLVSEGYQVISLDNYFTGSKENHVEGVEYREGHTKDIAKHIPETPDILFHLGEYSRVAASLEEPQLVFDLNVVGTFGVLEFWREKKCKLVYAGSSTKQITDAGDGVSGRDLAPYTFMKAGNSELVKNYARWYDLPYAITYFYNVYGPGERSITEYGTVVESFRSKFAVGEALTVRMPGTQKRNFTHVEDTINGIMLVAEKGENDEYGIAADETYTLLELAEMFGGEVEMLPKTKTSRSEVFVDNESLKALGWKQEHTLPKYVEACKKEV